jgi:hypothetical protein
MPVYQSRLSDFYEPDPAESFLGLIAEDFDGRGNGFLSIVQLLLALLDNQAAIDHFRVIRGLRFSVNNFVLDGQSGEIAASGGSGQGQDGSREAVVLEPIYEDDHTSLSDSEMDSSLFTPLLSGQELASRLIETRETRDIDHPRRRRHRHRRQRHNHDDDIWSEFHPAELDGGENEHSNDSTETGEDNPHFWDVD